MGQPALAENDFAYDWLPKLDVSGYDICAPSKLLHEGKMNGYFCQGFNPLLSAPNRRKITEALAKLKFLVVMDPLQTETARFWENHGAHNHVQFLRASRPKSSNCRRHASPRKPDRW